MLNDQIFEKEKAHKNGPRTQPPEGVSFNKGSSWLYSTLRVRLEPFSSTNLQIPPMDSPGIRGIATLFMT